MRFAVSLACLVLTGMMIQSAQAEGWQDRFEFCDFVGPDKSKLPYRLLKPLDYDKSKKYPVILFLHGAGERGDDNQAQLKHGMQRLATDPVQKDHPAFVIAPQCPKDEQWVDVPWSADSHQMKQEPTTALRNALALIEVVGEQYSIDEDRIYITGLSMGGFGTWDAIQRYPDRFAAAIPICGGGDPSYARGLVDLPIWVFHGAKDTTVKTSRSREMVRVLRELKGNVKYGEYPGVSHDSWTRTYNSTELYDWLFAQKREENDEEKPAEEEKP